MWIPICKLPKRQFRGEAETGKPGTTESDPGERVAAAAVARADRTTGAGDQ